eukprot:160842_1
MASNDRSSNQRNLRKGRICQTGSCPPNPSTKKVKVSRSSHQFYNLVNVGFQGFGLHNKRNKVSLSYRHIQWQFDKSRMQHMSVAESMIVGFAWQYYLPNQLDYNDISKSYSKEMLNLVGNNLRIFVDEYNLQIKKFPRDVTQGPCVDSNPPSLPLTTQEVEDYLQIIFKSNEWKSKLTDLKYFICDPHYNPMGKKQITKTFQCHKTKDRLYRFLYDLECRLPNTLHHPPETELESSKREPLNDIHNTATNTRDGRSESMQIQKLKRDLTTLNQQIGVDKLQIDCLNKTIIRLEKQIVKLQTFHGMKTSDLKERIQQRFIHDPVSFKQFVVDLSKSKALRKNIKVIETKDEIKSSVVEQDTYQIQGNRIRIALQTVRGKMSNESIDGMKNAIDGVPVLCLNKNGMHVFCLVCALLILIRLVVMFMCLYDM